MGTTQATLNYVGAHAKPCSRRGCPHGITHYKHHNCHSICCPCGQTTCFVCGQSACRCRGDVTGRRDHLHSFCNNWDHNGDNCGCLPCPDCDRAERAGRSCRSIEPSTGRPYCGECGNSNDCQNFIRQQRRAAAAAAADQQ